MPFKSAAQRGLFYAAKSNPAVRERTGISQSVANKMTSEDTGGKLPMFARKNAPGKNPLAFKHYREGSAREEASESAAEERAEQREGTRSERRQHNPGYGSGDTRMRGLLASGAGSGKIRPEPNDMSSLPGGSDASARPPGPRGAPRTPGLATWGALHGIKRAGPRHVQPRGEHPGAMGAGKQPIGGRVPPRANPVGMGAARNPIPGPAPRQMPGKGLYR